ncbi:hypothetical protein LCGC14_2478790 [marine sediment metagenome]|uniref:Uncharacterized protein n=1 Tax=marine sediment metagenome TaxID=412755 RepID=A0A0F9B870_9ZZZZ
MTDGANLNLPGAANITTAADDFAFVYAETTTLFKVLYFKVDGTAVVVSGSAAFPAGTSMLFQQTAAPTGWTKQTMHNNKAIRLQSGTVVTGGAVNFSTVFGTGKATDSHTLTSGESAAHTHVVADVSTGTQSSGAGTDLRTGTGTASGSAGGGGGHAHNLSNFNLQFVDFIIADKD